MHLAVCSSINSPCDRSHMPASGYGRCWRTMARARAAACWVSWAYKVAPKRRCSAWRKPNCWSPWLGGSLAPWSTGGFSRISLLPYAGSSPKSNGFNNGVVLCRTPRSRANASPPPLYLTPAPSTAQSLKSGSRMRCRTIGMAPNSRSAHWSSYVSCVMRWPGPTVTQPRRCALSWVSPSSG